MKQYRIVQKIYNEGTKYQESLYYPQVMESHTLNDWIEPWEYFTIWKGDLDLFKANACFNTINDAEEYIEKQKAMDIPVKTIIHPVN
jgi:hypothetical protein